MTTVLISGSSSGIGRAIAEYFLQNGMRVIGLARDHKKFVWKNDDYIPINVELSDISKLSNLIKEVLKKHPSISTFVSNAGYGDFKSLENFSAEQIEHFIDVNLVSHIVLCRALITHLKSNMWSSRC